MPSVRDVLGVSAVSLMRYGVRPEDDVYTAISLLERRAPHLAKLLKAVAGVGGAS
ncbi:hypothetical protein [Pyrobaculum neutrophilum]|uniref:PaREP10 n=1 Tax=Pyrobaculum neutrophilum (strain DSM 2338 / JCM 9278 / NBRC 100436 / V24Sta) TaxID=444157 RepID=B1YCN2_PYRNV|nr:hypothetical protein [Pyrobaculum neutrophilum]ACB39545.1 paREP10 [Pyrobaculum neutrophilum V24Sta]